jgi:hypothetical protein
MICRLGKAIDHHEDYEFSIDVQEAFHKIHSDVQPNRRQNVQRLEEASRVQLLALVSLASGACPDVVLNQPTHTWCMEVPAETM